jgi:hypothetical protein
MANPSLQIGNSNWAIKEDNLLGYSTAGTKFLPQPITMTRASAGTRVNSSGLVETVELLGSELVVNGDFATDSDWTKGIGWTISGGTANCDGTQTAYSTIKQIGVTPINTNYKMVFTITITSGNVIPSVGGSNGQGQISVSGTYTFYTIATTGDNNLYFGASSDFVGSIDNVSVKEVTKNNLARVDYDGTASSLLVEPQRTNLVTYSQDFSNGGWVKSRSTFTSNSIQSPSGLINMGYLTEDTTANNTHYMRDFLTLTDGVNYTLSVFAKAKERDIICLGDNAAAQSNAGVWFDLTNGLVLTQRSGYVGSIKDFGNGIYRCSVTYSASASRQYVDIALSLSDGVNVYTGDGTSGAYFWGAQLEEGSYATSYIPTSGSTVTRVKDQYSKTGISNLIGQTEGVIFMDWIMNHQSNSTSEDVFTLSVTDGTTNNLFVINNYNNALTVYLKAAGTNQFSNSSFSGSDGLRIKLAFAYKVNDFSLVINGSVIATDNSGSVPLLNKININAYETALPNDSILVKDFKLYTTRLTDSELIALTTI